jgi:glycosyltransferase involved in cell wall biosynthesis
MIKIVKKLIKLLTRVIDYAIVVLVFPFCLVFLLCASPWILKQRKIWNYSVKGSRKALILRGFTLEKLSNRGYEHLLPFRNRSLQWMGFLDATNSLKTTIKIADDLYLITWKTPTIISFIETKGLVATSTIFRELIAVLKLTSYCVKEQIGVLRAYKHNYPALQAFLVSRFIKIPFIVDISGNYELVRRITGKTFYFSDLNKLPFIRIFARRLSDWLLGLPLRHAFRVVGRNKTCYEHAFALGAPVDRLSLLRISNFNAAFNSYNPEQPPAGSVEYPYILFVGRLAKINLPIDVLDAFDIAAPHLPEYRLIIIGDGPIKDNIKKRRERSQYKNRIMLLGACLSEEVFNWTAHAKISICPYSGSTLVEAMLCGIPVIAYDVAGHPEIVFDDYTGFLVPFRDTAALAEKMIYVVHNYEEARIAGRRGRDLARVMFDKEKISEKDSMYYLQALTES